MDEKQRNDVIEAMKETSRILENAHRLERRLPVHSGGGAPDNPFADRLNLFSDPARFWTWRAHVEMGMVPNASELDEAVQLGARLIAADLKTGNLDRVREALLGQYVWLSALAAKTASKASAVGDSPYSADERAKLLKVAMQAQRQAAQTLCSAVALGKEGVTVGDG